MILLWILGHPSTTENSREPNSLCTSSLWDLSVEPESMAANRGPDPLTTHHLTSKKYIYICIYIYIHIHTLHICICIIIMRVSGGGLATAFCSYKALFQPTLLHKWVLEVKNNQKKPYQKEAPTPSKAPTKRQCDFRCL